MAANGADQRNGNGICAPATEEALNEALDDSFTRVLRELEQLPNRIATALSAALQTQHRLIVADVRAAMMEAVGHAYGQVGSAAPSNDQTSTAD